MASGINTDGKTVSVGDRVTIIGYISSLSGSDENTTVVVQPYLTTSTFNASILDVYTTEGTACGAAHGNLPAAGNLCTVTGLVTAISGSGITALLTVTLSQSGASVSGIPAGSVHSDNV